MLRRGNRQTAKPFGRNGCHACGQRKLIVAPWLKGKPMEWTFTEHGTSPSRAADHRGGTP
jgi:hypothetical protein